MIATGQVINISDKWDGERIQVRIRPFDNLRNDEKIPYAYPLLPKMLHIKPKVGEAVLVFCEDDNPNGGQRYYLGPLISQPQFFETQYYLGGATNGMKGGSMIAQTPVTNNNKGAFAKPEDIAIYGRKNTDIILTDNDIRIRCGVHELKDQKIEFNTLNPAFLKLKFYPNGLPYKKRENSLEIDMTNSVITERTETIGSVASVVADKINLIGNTGDPHIRVDDKEGSLSDEQMVYFLQNAHQLPYGDKLCEFLSEFLQMFKKHTHNYTNLEIVQDDTVKAFDRKYGTTEDQIGKILLSDSVRIN